MFIDLHIHTRFCGHAEGEISDYIDEAIRKGIGLFGLDVIKFGIFGFTDHLPVGRKIRAFQENRMGMEDVPQYLRECEALREQSRDQADIRIGGEADYFPSKGSTNSIKKLTSQIAAKKGRLDYLIGSVHYTASDKRILRRLDNPEKILRWWNRLTPQKAWGHYFKCLRGAAKSGLFDILGHPDRIFIYKPIPRNISKGQLGFYRKSINQSLDKIKETGVALEFNTSQMKQFVKTNGLRAYFWQKVCEKDIPIALGSDAHRPSDVGQYYKEALEFLESVGCREISHFKNRRRASTPLKKLIEDFNKANSEGRSFSRIHEKSSKGESSGRKGLVEKPHSKAR